jgi:sugar phosphate isomerase/epimerase
MNPFPENLALLVAGDSLAMLTSGLEDAHAAGFRSVQLNFVRHFFTDSELESVALVMRRLGLHAVAAGIYCDLLRPESDHLFGNSVERDLKPMIRRCREFLGTEIVVAWSGTMADDLLAQHPQNSMAESRHRLMANLAKLLPLLRECRVRLLLEPWHTHVLGSAKHLAEASGTAPDQLGVVLDAPNFFRNRDDLENHAALLPVLLETLAPCAGVVHLKDMRYITEDKFELPASGKGAVNYPLLLKLLRPLWPRIPFVIEHVLPAESRTPGEFVINHMKAANYPPALP